MLHDVLDALTGYEASLVTSDPFAIDVAHHYGFTIIRDDQNLSETDAISTATILCESQGVQSTLVIPADIPLLESEDIGKIHKSAPEKGCVLVPSTDKRGTNAVLRRPAPLFPLRFGNDSFTPHLAAAIATSYPCVVLSMPRIGLDIDTPDDLRQLAQAPGEKRSQLLARKFGIIDAPALVSS
jgi:2-phospho-L-lactate guanylyltransferase